MRFITEPITPGEQQLTERIRGTRRAKGLHWIVYLLAVLGFFLFVAASDGIATMLTGTEFIP